MKTLWVTFWVAVFLLLDVLDKLAVSAGNTFEWLAEKDWFVATITVLNVVLVLKMVGWL